MTTFNRTERRIIEFIRFNGPQSRARLASEFDLTPSALTRIAQKLIEGGVLRVGRRDHRGQRGQPPEMMEINPSGGYSVGIALNPDRCAVCLVDLSGEIIARACVALRGETTGDVVEVVARTLDRFLDEAGIARTLLIGAGLSTPGTSLPSARSPGNAAGYDGPLAASFAERLALPVSHENDGNVAALSEATFGAGRQLSSFALVHIDCEVGGGWILGRQLYRGANGNAAEFGFLHARPALRPSFGDLIGHLASTGVAEADAMRVAAEDPPGPAVGQWIARAAGQLAELIRILVWVNDPEAVIIGGSLPFPVLARLVDAVGGEKTRPDGWPFDLPKVLMSERAGLGLDAAAAHLPIIRDQTLFWLP